MSIQPRAVIFAEERMAGFVQVFREFLFESGFRQIICTTNPVEISNLIHTSHWPIIFVDHTNGVSDGMQQFEGIFKIPGHELLPIVFTAPGDNPLYDQFYQSIGAVGLIKKPLQTTSAEKILRAINPQPKDPAIRLAHQISKSLLHQEYASVEQHLERLRSLPQFRKQAEIALLRVDISKGNMSKANERFRHLLRDRPRDLRVLSEYAEFLKKNALYFNALKCYQRIQNLNPKLSFKHWDQLTLHVELEQIDEAARLLESMQSDDASKEQAAEALARMMHFMGLQNSIPNFLKSFPGASKNFNLFARASSVKKVASQ